MSSSDMPSPPVRFVLGLLFFAGGVVGILATFDVGPLHAGDINGPPRLGAAAGAIFVPGGAFLWAGDAAARHPWFANVLAALMLAGFAASATGSPSAPDRASAAAASADSSSLPSGRRRSNAAPPSASAR